MELRSKRLKIRKSIDVEEEGFQVFFLRLFEAGFSSFLGVLSLTWDLKRQKGGKIVLELTGGMLEGKTFQKSVVMATILKS